MTIHIIPIISATRLEASPQKDGRLAVHELHESDIGDKEERFYLAESEDDLDVMLEANSRLFLERLASRS